MWVINGTACLFWPQFFARPDAEAAGVMSLVCEPGNWETIAVSIVSVESEEESELTVVGPDVIKKDDRLVMNE